MTSFLLLLLLLLLPFTWVGMRYGFSSLPPTSKWGIRGGKLKYCSLFLEPISTGEREKERNISEMRERERERERERGR
jgi:hypothetical protein